MAEKSIQERITAFNKQNEPFYLVDHEDGNFSLCLPLDLLSDEYYPYCQDAFDAYASEIGEPAYSNYGLRTHGNGYEWQVAFQEAFKDDPNINRILFDCEAGGFFCNCLNLDIIEDFGRRFKEICEDTEEFTPIVLAGIRREAEQEKLLNSVRGQLMQNPQATFDIMTPYGDVQITPDIGKKLLDGEMSIVEIAGVHYADHELLDQPVVAHQTDIFNEKLIRMKTEEASEMGQEPEMMM